MLRTVHPQFVHHFSVPFRPVRFVLFGLFLHPTQRVVLYLIVQQRFADFHVTERHQGATGAHPTW